MSRWRRRRSPHGLEMLGGITPRQRTRQAAIVALRRLPPANGGGCQRIKVAQRAGNPANERVVGWSEIDAFPLGRGEAGGLLQILLRRGVHGLCRNRTRVQRLS